MSPAGGGRDALYRTLFEHNPVPMWVYDLETLRILEVNDAALARYGYARAEFLTMTVADIRPAEDLPRLRAAIAELRPGLRGRGRWRHRLKSGQLIDVDVAWSMIEREGRGCALSVSQDITDQVRLERALRETEARFAAVVQHAPIAFSLKDAAGHYLFCNDEARRALAVADESFLGRTARDLFGDAAAETEAVERQVLESGQPAIATIDLDLPDDQPYRRTLTVKFPIRDDAGAIVAIGGFGVDLTGQRRAEEALRAREQLFDQVVDVMQEAIWIQEAGILTFANPTAARLFGAAKPEDLIGRSVLSLLHPEQRPVSEQRIKTLMAERKPLPVVEVRTLGLDGVERVAEIRGVPLVQRDETGRERVLGVTSGRDVTERNRMIQDLREIEARFEALVQNAPVAISLKDRAGGYLYFNAEGERALRLAGDDYVGKTARDVLEPTAAEVVAAADRKLLETGRPQLFEVDFPSGVPYASALMVRLPVRDGAGAIVAIGSFAIDISKQRQAERALQATEQRFKHIVELVQEGIWIHDNGNISFANPAAARLFGAEDPAQLIGRSIFDLLDPEDRAAAMARTRSLIDRQVALVPAEMRVTGLDGKQRVAELQAAPLVEGGKVLSVASGRDVTAHRAAEAQLRQAVKMEAVGQLTGGVAHDFNNLLTVIIGSLDLDPAKVPAHLQVPIEQAMRAAERGAALTYRLLAFSRRQTLRPGPVDCNRLVIGMDELLRRSLGEQIEIQLKLAPDLKLALADGAQLESALLNLAINARDAMPAGGTLTIETANAVLDADYAAQNVEVKPGDYAMLAVSDTGTGMTPETVAHAFEPFFTTKEVGKGTGLGLSMVYGFAKQSNGHVRIYSEPGLGTTVRLYLPRLATKAAPERTETAARAGAGGGEVVLVVEDDEKVRKLVLQQLESLGYRAIEAANGAEALAVIESDAAIDLLFTDMVMPGGMSGAQLAEAARRLRPGLKVLFTSGYAEGSLQARGGGDAGFKLLSKPYRKQALAEKLREVLDG
jgi:PAS domain S-box-containing protein